MRPNAGPSRYVVSQNIEAEVSLHFISPLVREAETALEGCAQNDLPDSGRKFGSAPCPLRWEE